MQDVGNYELLVGALVAALFLIGLVWGPLYAIVLRSERRHRAEVDAEEAAIDATALRDRDRAQLDADMRHLSQFFSEPRRPSFAPPSAEYPTMPRFEHMPFMMDPMGSVNMLGFGLHAMDRGSLGGEISC